MIRHGTSWDKHETEDKTFSVKLTFVHVFVALCTYNEDVGGVVMMMMVKMLTICCG